MKVNKSKMRVCLWWRMGLLLPPTLLIDLTLLHVQMWFKSAVCSMFFLFCDHVRNKGFRFNMLSLGFCFMSEIHKNHAVCHHTEETMFRSSRMRVFISSLKWQERIRSDALTITAEIKLNWLDFPGANWMQAAYSPCCFAHNSSYLTLSMGKSGQESMKSLL